MVDFKSLVERICENEGFKAKPYKCTEGVLTIGHGITYLTKEESEHIVAGRVSYKHLNLLQTLDWYEELPPNVQGVILEMCFQIGTNGMLKFKKMIANMKNKDWKAASDEMKDSKWYRQTKNRCERLAKIVEETKE
jgi:lysozyme